MKILFVHGIGEFGGSSRSLIENLNILKENNDLHIITANGSVLEFFNKVTSRIINVKGLTKFDNTKYGYYRGFRWGILLREIYYIPHSLYAFYKAKKEWKNFDIIHINEITLIFPIFLASIFFNSKVVVHARALYNNDGSFKDKLVNYVLKKHSQIVLAIDENVFISLPSGLNKKIINNSFSTVKNSDSVQYISERHQFDLVIGYVGTISKMKGIFDLVDSIKIIGLQYNIVLLIAGQEIKKFNSVIYFLLKKMNIISGSQNELKEILQTNKIIDKVKVLGHINEIENFYKSIDVLCFPTHLDAPGRPIIEAAAYNVPSIAAIKNPCDDTIINKVSGITYEPKNIEQLTESILFFIKDKKKIDLMGSEARKLYINNFDPLKNTNKLISIYKEITSNINN